MIASLLLLTDCVLLKAYNQWDQMALLLLQYLAIYSNENLPNGIKVSPKSIQNFAKCQINLQTNVKYIIFLSKWRNLAKSGHTAYNDRRTHRIQAARLYSLALTQAQSKEIIFTSSCRKILKDTQPFRYISMTNINSSQTKHIYLGNGAL